MSQEHNFRSFPSCVLKSSLACQRKDDPLSPAGGDRFVNRHNGGQFFVPNRHQFRRLFSEDGGVRQHGADDLPDTVNLPARTREGTLQSVQPKI